MFLLFSYLILTDSVTTSTLIHKQNNKNNSTSREFSKETQQKNKDLVKWGV